MILVFLGVLLIALVVGICVYCHDLWTCEEVGGAIMGTSVALLIPVICVLIWLSVKTTELSVIDDKIAMYEQENEKIETQITEVVKQYQEYETGIFTDVDPDSAMTLVALYPNLKSDVLVQKQIETYIANNNHIKSLKEDQINGSVYRWWLYFGG